MIDGTNNQPQATWARALADALSLFAGEALCAACGGERQDCLGCHGRGVEMPDGDTLGTLTSQADNAATALEEAIGSVADVVARASVAVERIAAGRPSADRLGVGVAGLVDKLRALAPALGHVLELVNNIADANESVDVNDPRTIESEARRLRGNHIERCTMGTRSR